MENPDEILAETAVSLAKNWGLPEDAGTDWETVIRILAARIREMLAFEMETLANAMYRIDVNEAKFHTALSLDSEEKRAFRIAELVVEREREKIITRKKYRQG